MQIQRNPANAYSPGAQQYFDGYMPKHFVNWPDATSNLDKVWTGSESSASSSVAIHSPVQSSDTRQTRFRGSGSCQVGRKAYTRWQGFTATACGESSRSRSRLLSLTRFQPDPGIDTSFGQTHALWGRGSSRLRNAEKRELARKLFDYGSPPSVQGQRGARGHRTRSGSQGSLVEVFVNSVHHLSPVDDMPIPRKLLVGTRLCAR